MVVNIRDAGTLRMDAQYQICGSDKDKLEKLTEGGRPLNTLLGPLHTAMSKKTSHKSGGLFIAVESKGSLHLAKEPSFTIIFWRHQPRLPDLNFHDGQ
jgi:hypothetical protein